jgi:hypothetical protein
MPNSARVSWWSKGAAGRVDVPPVVGRCAPNGTPRSSMRCSSWSRRRSCDGLQRRSRHRLRRSSGRQGEIELASVGDRRGVGPVSVARLRDRRIVPTSRCVARQLKGPREARDKERSPGKPTSRRYREAAKERAVRAVRQLRLRRRHPPPGCGSERVARNSGWVWLSCHGRQLPLPAWRPPPLPLVAGVHPVERPGRSRGSEPHDGDQPVP